LADNGKTVIHGRLDDLVADDGLWRDDGSGTLSVVCVERTDAPGTSTMFSSFGGFSMNRQGQIVLVSGLMDVSGGATQTAGIWRDGQNGLQLIARRGDPAPGTTAEFNSFGFGDQPMLDISGRASFVGYLTEADGKNPTGIFSERGGNGLELVIRSGSGNAPGTGAMFETFDNLRQNSDSQLAFLANLAGASSTDNRGIWRETREGGLTLVARTGSAAPGTELPFINFFDHTLSLNDNGQAAFLAEVRETSHLRRVYRGIWAENTKGELKLVALQGQLVDVSDDPLRPDLRTILSLDFQSAGFNDLGQLTFAARFSDGSNGIFISDLVAVPEPPIATLTMSTILGMVYRPCRKHPSCRSRF
jgi:hypothetical protein